MGEGRFQHIARPVHVDREDILALPQGERRRGVNHHIAAIRGHCLGQGGGIANIGLHQARSVRVLLGHEGRKVQEGQLRHPIRQAAGEMVAQEAGPAGDEHIQLVGLGHVPSFGPC